MITVGVRELKQRASELVRLVRQDKQRIRITYHGRTVAWLVPATSQSPLGGRENEWAKLDELAAEIGRAWPSGVTAQQAISEGRD